MSTDGQTLKELEQSFGSLDDDMSDEQYNAILIAKLTQAQGALRDLMHGADQLLEPALQLEGWMKRYALEVKRIARLGLGAK